MLQRGPSQRQAIQGKMLMDLCAVLLPRLCREGEDRAAALHGQRLPPRLERAWIVTTPPPVLPGRQNPATLQTAIPGIRPPRPVLQLLWGGVLGSAPCPRAHPSLLHARGCRATLLW